MEIFGLYWLSWQLIILLLILGAIFLYRHFTILKRLGIPGPAPLPFFGNQLEQFFKGIHKTDEEWLQKYGKVFGYYSGYQPVIAITDPEILKAVLIKDFQNFTDRPQSGNLPKLLLNTLFFMRGRTWKRTRNIITPTFSAGKLKNLIPIINKCAETLVSNINDKAGQDVAIRKFFIHFTMDAIASTAFGIDIDSQKQPDSPFVKNLDKVFKLRKWTRIPIAISAAVPCIGKLLYKLGITTWPRESIQFYEETGKALINERRNNKMSRVDFLQMLMNAEFDESKEEYIHNKSTFSNGVSNGHQTHKVERLSDDEVNGQAFVFFLAGFETTASLLRYSAYVLALNSGIDAKLYDEIQKHVGQDVPDHENIGNLKYMDQFISEVLRFYPPVPRLSRVAKEDITVGGITILKGTGVHVPVWAIHHSEENYPCPETFNPERFSQGKKGVTEGITFLPFGTGPRNCIGMRLALVEAKIALVYLLRKIRFVKCDKTQVPLDLNHFGILRPETPIQVRIETR
ncbi:cytochrome P450 3A24-like [Mercenaria mercenaria]|uniref:cytochrome P450 3A24-like n=1 Tax=Mercenaria mercenaria TaxID=6596 RepID=UPI00234F7DCC|nr:cytochrome P450 3A24-like [Mercenaria mercenaria]